MTAFPSLQPLKGIRQTFKFSNDAEKARAIFSVAQEVLRETSVLSSADRELIAAFTSSLNQCKFCTGSHKVFALEQGADPIELEEVTSGNYLSHRLAPVFNYLKTLTLNPSQLQQSQYDEVILAGFTEEELHDAILVCAAFNMYNRIVEGHFVQENSDTWNESASMISNVGYDGRYLQK